jgi:hypothetical protein
MSVVVRAALAGALLAGLAGCGSSGVFGRDAPDEFAIGRNAPLVVPPDYNLSPPRPGAPRPLEADAQTRAIEALFGPGVRVPPKSAAEQQLLDKAGASEGKPEARATAGDPETEVVDKGVMLRSILDAPAGDSDAATATASVGG